MKTKALLLLLVSGIWGTAVANDYTDDIYYNPKKSNTSNTKKTSSTKSTIVDFSKIDVDEYNRRGQYYSSPIDTIGSYIESEPDFIYTTEIQKYYNPTIVVDNADILADVLKNSYGNIDIIYNYNGPTFSAWTPYYSPWYSGWYSGWYNPWSWNWGWSWNFGPLSWSFGFYDPWFAWSPGWNWGWTWNPRPWHGPVWGPGPGRPNNWWAQYRPNGRAPFGPSRPMASHGPNINRPSSHPGNYRPGTNFNGNQNGGYNPGPSHGTVTQRPGLGNGNHPNTPPSTNVVGRPNLSVNKGTGSNATTMPSVNSVPNRPVVGTGSNKPVSAPSTGNTQHSVKTPNKNVSKNDRTAIETPKISGSGSKSPQPSTNSNTSSSNKNTSKSSVTRPSVSGNNRGNMSTGAGRGNIGGSRVGGNGASRGGSFGGARGGRR